MNRICSYPAIIDGRLSAKRYARLLSLSLLVSLSAKPAAAQFPLELGAALEASAILVRARASDFTERSDARAETTVEGAYGYCVYVASFPYEGWGWRAEASAGFRGRPGRYSGNEISPTGGDGYGRAGLSAVYVAGDWSAVGFGASLLVQGRYLDFGGVNRYAVLGNRRAVGLHASWSQLSRFYTLTLRADLTASAGWDKSRVFKRGVTADGHYGEWALAPTIQFSVPVNRGMWIRGLRKERVIYSPRT